VADAAVKSPDETDKEAKMLSGEEEEREEVKEDEEELVVVNKAGGTDA
jgi:hypothetical protein